jgi:hypothetical protein
MTRDPIAPSRGTYVARAIKGAIVNPGDGAQKVIEKLSRRRERRARNGRLPSDRATADWERRLHELLEAPWPCPHAAEFPPAWDSAIATMAERGLRVGRKNYGGDDDADARRCPAWPRSRASAEIAVRSPAPRRLGRSFPAAPTRARGRSVGVGRAAWSHRSSRSRQRSPRSACP